MGKLIYALLEDGLYDPPVVAQDVFFAVRTDSSPGAGTAENPYRAGSPGLTEAANAALFDGLMNDAAKTPANAAIHLGPGTFFTKGYVYTPGSTGAGWSPRSGQRLLGAGLNETTLKLTGHNTTGKFGHAIGMDLASASSFLQGYEVSDLTVDVNVVAGGNTGSVCGGAISVTGRDIYIKRVRVKNYGGRVTNAVFPVILAGKARAGQSYEVQNNVIEDCILQSVGDLTNGAKARLLCFEGEVSGSPAIVYAVKSSVIRGCDIDALSASNAVIAISPGLGLGVIVEENQVYNCQTGLDLTDAAAQDLVIWDNYFHKVATGMNFSNTGTGANQAKRLVLLANTLSLVDATTSKGIVISGSGTSHNFQQIVARKNIIRNENFASGTLLNTGINVANVQDAIVEDNVINNCLTTTALVYNSTKVQNMKSFNNQNNGGALMRAHDSVLNRPLPELADAAQDSLMAF